MHRHFTHCLPRKACEQVPCFKLRLLVSFAHCSMVHNNQSLNKVVVDPPEQLLNGELEVVPSGGVEHNLASFVDGAKPKQIFIVPIHDEMSVTIPSRAARAMRVMIVVEQMRVMTMAKVVVVVVVMTHVVLIVEEINSHRNC